jgi:hypothetical protein
MSGLNLLVFREDRRRASGKELKAAITAHLEQLCGHYSQQTLLSALLLAGEIECGVADSDPQAASCYELVTDRIAAALLAGEFAAPNNSNFQNPDLHSLLAAVRALPVFEQLSISIPEGFAYYALHPLVYADVIRQLPVCAYLLLVGIRSIGTTLSSVVAAAARARGIVAERITVRPQGHPYNRTVEFTVGQIAAVRNAMSRGARFAVVDEGPGLSGSSFLAVAEALEAAGAPAEKIMLISSHAPNVNALCAENAACRWQRFRCIPVSSETRRPAAAVEFIGGGQWRSRAFAGEPEWPAAWTSLERLKYLSSAENYERSFFKFAGLGHYGDAVLEREKRVAAAGFGLMPREESDGFISCPWIYSEEISNSKAAHLQSKGRPASSSDLSARILARLAEYCVFRQRAFTVELPNLDALQKMAQHNLRELGLDLPVDLRLERPVIADGRMQPHEWLLGANGKLLKTDSGSHGDDHFFPGPTDIAWDLAGAIIEWKMNEQQTAEFLDRYRHASGDDASARIDGFVKAYAVFRLAYCLMAENAMNGSDEQLRLASAATTYRAALTRMQACNLAAAV